MWILTANTRALSGQLCEMPCCVLKIGHKLKIDNGVCFLWNDGLHLDKGIGQMSLILIGLILLVLWKRSKEDIFCYQALKKQKKKEDLRRHTQAWSLFHTVQFKKKLMLVPFAWNIYSSTETEESGKEISHSALLEVRFRMSITMQCPVSVGFVQMSEY